VCQLKSKIEERRFMMVSILEKSVPLHMSSNIASGGEKPHHHGSSSISSSNGPKNLAVASSEASSHSALPTGIRWEDLNARLVKYVKHHFEVGDEFLLSLLVIPYQ
jgi:hypothetical protein